MSSATVSNLGLLQKQIVCHNPPVTRTTLKLHGFLFDNCGIKEDFLPEKTNIIAQLLPNFANASQGVDSHRKYSII